MSTLDTGLTFIRTASKRVSSASEWLGRWFKELMPKGLYARALLIIIVPMVILQSVVAFVFMERHWNTVTRRLSAAVVQDIASLIDVYKGYPQDNIIFEDSTQAVLIQHREEVMRRVTTVGMRTVHIVEAMKAAVR